MLRNAEATRPWEHVLEPLAGYLLLAKGLYEGNTTLSSAWNFAPAPAACVPVERLVQQALQHLSSPLEYRVQANPQKEDQLLQLDASKAQQVLGWRPLLNLEETIAWTFQWYSQYYANSDMTSFTHEQIKNYFVRQGVVTGEKHRHQSEPIKSRL